MTKTKTKTKHEKHQTLMFSTSLLKFSSSSFLNADVFIITKHLFLILLFISILLLSSSSSSFLNAQQQDAPPQFQFLKCFINENIFDPSLALYFPRPQNSSTNNPVVTTTTTTSTSSNTANNEGEGTEEEDQSQDRDDVDNDDDESTIVGQLPQPAEQYPCPSLIIRNVHVRKIVLPKFFVFGSILVENVVVESFVDFRIGVFNDDQNNNNNNNNNPTANIILRNVTIFGRNIHQSQTKLVSNYSISSFSLSQRLFQTRNHLDTRNPYSFIADPTYVKLDETNQDQINFLRHNFIDTFEMSNCTISESPPLSSPNELAKLPLYHTSVDLEYLKVANRFLIENVKVNSTFSGIYIKTPTFLPGADIVIRNNDVDVFLPTVKRLQNSSLSGLRLTAAPTAIHITFVNFLESQLLLMYVVMKSTSSPLSSSSASSFTNILILNNNLRAFAPEREYVYGILMSRLYLGDWFPTTFIPPPSAVHMNNNNNNNNKDFGSIQLSNNDIEMGEPSQILPGNKRERSDSDSRAISLLLVYNISSLRITSNKMVSYSQGKLSSIQFSRVGNFLNGVFILGNFMKSRCEGINAFSLISIHLKSVESFKLKSIVVSENVFDTSFILFKDQDEGGGGSSTDSPFSVSIGQFQSMMIFHASSLVPFSEQVVLTDNTANIHAFLEKENPSLAAFFGILNSDPVGKLQKILLENNRINKLSGSFHIAVFCSIDSSLVGFDEDDSRNNNFGTVQETERYKNTNLTLANNLWNASEFVVKEATTAKFIVSQPAFKNISPDIYLRAARFASQAQTLLMNDNSGFSHNIIVNNTIIIRLPHQKQIDCSVAIAIFAGSYTSSSGVNWPRYNRHFSLLFRKNSLILAKPAELSFQEIETSKSFFAANLLSILTFGPVADETAQQKSFIIEKNEIYSEFGGVPSIIGLFGGLHVVNQQQQQQNDNDDDQNQNNNNNNIGMQIRNNTVFVRSVGDESNEISIVAETEVFVAPAGGRNVPIVVFIFGQGPRFSSILAIRGERSGNSWETTRSSSSSTSPALLIEHNSIVLERSVGVFSLAIGGGCDGGDDSSSLSHRCIRRHSTVLFRSNSIRRSGPHDRTTLFYGLLSLGANLRDMVNFTLLNNYLELEFTTTPILKGDDSLLRCNGVVFNSSSRILSPSSSSSSSLTLRNNVLNFSSSNCHSVSLVEVAANSLSRSISSQTEIIGNQIYVSTPSGGRNKVQASILNLLVKSDSASSVSSTAINDEKTLTIKENNLVFNNNHRESLSPTTTKQSAVVSFISFEEDINNVDSPPAETPSSSSSITTTKILFENNNISRSSDDQKIVSSAFSPNIASLFIEKSHSSSVSKSSEVVSLFSKCNLFLTTKNNTTEEASFLQELHQHRHQTNNNNNNNNTFINLIGQNNINININITREEKCLSSSSSTPTNTSTPEEQEEDYDSGYSTPLEESNNGLGGFGLVSSSIASSIVPSAGFGISRQQAMINFVQNIRNGDCSGIAEKDAIAPADSPTQLSIGDSDARFYIGGAVGNVVLTVGLVMLMQLCGAFFLKRTGSSSWNRPFSVFARCHVAMILFICFSLLFAPTVKFGLVVAVVEPNVQLGEKFLAIIFAGVYLIITFYYTYWSLWGRERKEAYRLIHRREGRTDKKSFLVRTFEYWFEGPGEWRMPLKNSKHGKHVSEQDMLGFDAATPILDGFQGHSSWFGAVEFTVQFALSFSEFLPQLVPKNKSCLTSAIALLIVLGFYLLLCLWLRPFQEKFNRIAVPLITFFQILIIALAFYFQENPPGFIVQMAIAAMSLQSVVVLIVLIASLSPLAKSFLRVYKRLKKRSNNKNDNNNNNNARNQRHHGFFLNDDKNNENKTRTLASLMTMMMNDDENDEEERGRTSVEMMRTSSKRRNSDRFNDKNDKINNNNNNKNNNNKRVHDENERRSSSRTTQKHPTKTNDESQDRHHHRRRHNSSEEGRRLDTNESRRQQQQQSSSRNLNTSTAGTRKSQREESSSSSGRRTTEGKRKTPDATTTTTTMRRQPEQQSSSRETTRHHSSHHGQKKRQRGAFVEL